MAVGVYLLFNAGGQGARGWGTVMSTDTALALGALAIVGPSNNARLRVFLLTLVVIDDLAALLVIAVVYAQDISVTALLIALGLFMVLISLRFLNRWRGPVAVVVGVGMWLALFESGIDPVIAGLAIGLVTSAYPPARDDLERATEDVRSFREQPTPELAYTAQRRVVSSISANERIQFRLHPWTSFVIVPIFALANAGIHLDGTLLSDAIGSPVTLGIVAAYVVGKPTGIVGAAWLATRRVFGGSRPALTWPALAGTGAVAGVGFTVSLLIAGRAFDGELLAEAKVGILAAAVLSPLVAWTIFRVIALLPASLRARQLGRVAEQIIDLSDEVDPARDHVRGNPDAPVTIVEYGDFECPYCGQAEPVIRELLASHDEDLRYVFRHLPLADVHPHAQAAAEASEAAAAQGAFWDMHDMLLSHQDALTLRDIRGYAESLGLDADPLIDEVRDRSYAPRVSEDVMSADASGVSGTPTFFVNGRRHHGVYDIPALSAAVKAARATAPAAQPVS
jgi:Na+/H+ antiporter NhaA/predicted DsbA family dithiol-disulfide isomerase